MTEEFKKQIETEARQAVTELLAQAKLKKGDVFVVGCSSSEIVGGHIGKDSSLEAAQAVYAGIAPVLAAQGIWLAAQCCEHLNRAIIIRFRINTLNLCITITQIRINNVIYNTFICNFRKLCKLRNHFKFLPIWHAYYFFL